jgi:hypothetical protein
MDYSAIIDSAINYEDRKASDLKNTIIKLIKNFELKLSDDLEIALIINTLVVKPTAVSAHNSRDLIIFSGLTNGATIEIVQSISQTNFAIIAVKKEDPQAPAKRIGFKLD